LRSVVVARSRRATKEIARAKRNFKNMTCAADMLKQSIPNLPPAFALSHQSPTYDLLDLWTFAPTTFIHPSEHLL
jgi:hypothetical protein